MVDRGAAVQVVDNVIAQLAPFACDGANTALDVLVEDEAMFCAHCFNYFNFELSAIHFVWYSFWHAKSTPFPKQYTMLLSKRGAVQNARGASLLIFLMICLGNFMRFSVILAAAGFFLLCLCRF